MLKLEQVSKIYTAHGVVSTGFSKVNLEFNLGEFVAITGESGSGKSTLLNVISGLDSYEEGEMYINGKPTSGFSKEDIEDYRKEYIASIFQTFNLINSYTVYQNIELVLLMSGYKKSDVKERVTAIINQVGLTEYAKTKASKLSGGQKQRVAIARALAKETPIIVADEPTGNLDVKSAEEIIKLLHDISKDKLVIIVTHNYDQVEPYVTRKIQLHDGKIIEDKKFNNNLSFAEEEIVEENNTSFNSDRLPKLEKPKNDTLRFGNMVRLGTRNTFNIVAKFLLMAVVFIFMCSGVIASYTSTRDMQGRSETNGWNGIFQNQSLNRIVISKKDKSIITDEDFEEISNFPNVKEVIKQDVFVDTMVNLADAEVPPEEGNFWVNAKVEPIDDKEIELVYGRMPENDNEAVIVYSANENSYMESIIESILATTVKVEDWNTGNKLVKEPIKITGYASTNEDFNNDNGMYYECILYVTNKAADQMSFAVIESYCNQEIEFAGKILEGNSGQGLYPIRTSSNVEKGEIYISEEIDYLTERRAIGMPLTIRNNSIYSNDSFDFTVGAVYTKNNLSYLLDRDDFDAISGSVFINPEDFASIFGKGNYQSSVFVKDLKEIDSTRNVLEAAGYRAFKISDGIVPWSEAEVLFLKLTSNFVLIFLLIVLFFITYFIVKLILKSRNVYFATIRMLGATKGNCASLLRTELFIVCNIAFVIVAGLSEAIRRELINGPETLVNFLSILEGKDYLLLYLVLAVMSLLLASRYARSMFKKVAMDAYREVV